MNQESVILTPDPERMIEGLRDTGYEFETAVADIVDNSVAAGATKVELSIAFDMKGRLRLLIADDGHGMDQNGLQNAMRYGAAKRPSAASLGKYGLGLKTASTAFCRRLSVISRPDGSTTPMMATWDLDHVRDTREWSMLLSGEGDGEAIDYLNRIAAGRAGTVVLWDKVDRLFSKDYVDNAGKPARNALEKKVESLRQHMAMVYQRFLSATDDRAQTVEMIVNGKPLAAWDPFATGLAELVAGHPVPVELDSGKQAEFTVRAYIMPRGEEMSAEQAKNIHVSPERQGIYIYRENRLIHDADWLGMYQKDPHYNLIRVEFSFDHKLDDAFHLDIKKSQIILNDDLWNYLKDEFLPAPRREANRRYREGMQKKIGKKSEGAHDTSNSNIRDREADAGGATVRIADPNTGEVLVENPQGKFKLKIAIGSAKRPGEVFIQPVDSIPNGLLFEPALIDQHRAVRVNTSHPYYHKVYVPNLARSVTLQGMDSLLWALCVAELTTTREATHQLFGDMRYEVSRILEKLVDTLPEPELSQNAA